MAFAPQQERQMVFTTKLVEEATDKINDGIVVKRYQNPWLKSEVGLRRAGVSFRMTPDEQQIANFEKFGYKSWYDWRIDKWGTKWNESDLSIGQEYTENNDPLH